MKTAQSWDERMQLRPRPSLSAFLQKVHLTFPLLELETSVCRARDDVSPRKREKSNAHIVVQGNQRMAWYRCLWWSRLIALQVQDGPRQNFHLNVVVVAYTAQHVLRGLDALCPCPHAKEAPDNEELQVARK